LNRFRVADLKDLSLTADALPLSYPAMIFFGGRDRIRTGDFGLWISFSNFALLRRRLSLFG